MRDGRRKTQILETNATGLHLDLQSSFQHSLYLIKMHNNLDVCPVSQCAAPLSYSWGSTLMHSSLQPSCPNSVGWDKLCTSRASLCQGPAQTLPAHRQQRWKAGSVPAAGNGKCLGPNLVPLTADVKWRVAEWEERL